MPIQLENGERVTKWSLEALNYGHDLNAGAVPDPPLITVYTGERGHEKTLSMVAALAAAHANGFRVVATDNLELKFGEVFDLGKFLDNEYRGCLIAIDEFEEYADSLRYMSDVALDFVGVLIQLRHQENEILATTQFPGEVLSRVRRRIDWEVKCFDPAWGTRNAGRYISQTWVRDPFRDVPYRTSLPRRVWKADRFWGLYNTHARVNVGSIRRQSKNRRAIAELRFKKLVFGCMWDAVVKGNQPVELAGEVFATVSTSEVQFALAEADPPELKTETMIGKILGELGADRYRAGANARRWRIPRELFAEADGGGVEAAG